MSQSDRFCPSCGAAHDSGNHFCPSCGHRFDDAPDASAPAEPEAAAPSTLPPAPASAPVVAPAAAPGLVPAPVPAGGGRRGLVVGAAILGVLVLVAVAVAIVLVTLDRSGSGMQRYSESLQRELAPVSDANEDLESVLEDLDDSGSVEDARAVIDDAQRAVDSAAKDLPGVEVGGGDDGEALQRSARDALAAERDYLDALEDALAKPLSADLHEIDAAANDAARAWNKPDWSLGTRPPAAGNVDTWILRQQRAEQQRKIAAANARKQAAREQARRRAARAKAARRAARLRAERRAAATRAEAARLAALNAPKSCADYMFADGGRSADITVSGVDCGTATTVATCCGWPGSYSSNGFSCNATSSGSASARYRCTNSRGAWITFLIGNPEAFL